ncbi:MAG: amidase [Idiomarina sp. 34-48-12]|nr:MAG: amidase [Idiomarina sp. 34-48-12]
MKTIKAFCWLAFFVLFSTTLWASDDPSIEQLQYQLNRGEVTSVVLVERYLDRIARHNRDGAELQAVLSVQEREQLLQLAKRLDAEREAGNVRSSMHGIPVLLKDNIDTADGLANTAGSYLLRDHMPPDDAFIVAKLREAGAIILGKANLSEWANFRSTNSSSGWSSLGGLVKNPYDQSRTACGSSSGSAAAVSANFIPVAVGTETDGSLVCPAAINGIVTIKPTVGLLSRDGIIPISASQDTAGPMARSVADAVHLMMAMQGHDKNDGASYNDTTNYIEHLKTDGLKGKRIGVMRELAGYNTELDQVFNRRIEELKAAGAIIVDDLNFPNGRNWGGDEYTVLLYEFAHGMREYFKQSPHPQFTSLEDLIAANQEHAGITMKWFGQELFEMSVARQTDEEAYKKAKADAQRKAGKEGIDAVLKEHQLDLLIAPTTSPAWKIDLINGDHFTGSASGAAAVAGYPHITVPMGFVKHMPVGLSFFGAARSEGALIEAAHAFEMMAQARRAPVVASPH